MRRAGEKPAMVNMKIMMAIILFSALIAPLVSFDKNTLCDDYFFTNISPRGDFTRIISAYPRNKFTADEKLYIYACGERYGINPIVLLIKLQQEQMLVSNNKTNQYKSRMLHATGYNHKNQYGFSNQVRNCARVLRKRFDAWTNQPASIDGVYEPVMNAATYSLYRYCPFYDGGKMSRSHVLYGYCPITKGNRKFIEIRRAFEDKLK